MLDQQTKQLQQQAEQLEQQQAQLAGLRTAKLALEERVTRAEAVVVDVLADRPAASDVPTVALPGDAAVHERWLDELPQQDTRRPPSALQQGARRKPKQPPPPPAEAQAEDQVMPLQDQNLLRAEQALGNALTEEQSVAESPGARKQTASQRRLASRPRPAYLEVQAVRLSGISAARALLPVIGAANLQAATFPARCSILGCMAASGLSPQPLTCTEHTK